MELRFGNFFVLMVTVQHVSSFFHFPVDLQGRRVIMLVNNFFFAVVDYEISNCK